MKAAFYEGNRTVSTGEAHAQAPGKGEARIEVAYCGICGTDVHIFHGAMDRRVTMPQVLGHEMSGTVAEVGEGVEGWRPGDRVVVRPLDHCGQCPACLAGHTHICQNLKFLGIDTPGAFQGSWTVPAHTLHRLPEGMDMRLGALIEPLAVACHDVRLGRTAAGEHAVVIGGGPIGILIALVARQAGAEVLVCEVAPWRLSFAGQLGFDTAHAAEEDVVAIVNERTGGAGADVVFEVSGAAPAIELMTELPRTRGRIVNVAIVPKPQPVNLFKFFWRELVLIGARVYEAEDFDRAIELAASGGLPLEKVITEVYPLDDFEGAMRRMESGDETMKVLVDCRA